jgi:hypothetical protein
VLALQNRELFATILKDCQSMTLENFEGIMTVEDFYELEAYWDLSLGMRKIDALS